MDKITSFHELFEIILKGTKEESRLAARSVRKIVYSNVADSKDKFKDIKALINNSSTQYYKITEGFRQENFGHCIILGWLFE